MRRFPVAALLFVAACGGSHTALDAARRTTTTPPLHATTDLTDGKHFGFVAALDPAHFRIVFDVAELLTGAEAERAAKADGTVVTEGGNYVLNPDDRMNRITIDPNVEVRVLEPCCELHHVAFQDWLAGFEPDDRTFYGTSKSYYEITIRDGKVVAVDEVIVP